ncbi:hypothetical protein LZU96_08875 [Pantoea agglomerans]|uniref:tail fiber/spike domain-containing protein n=1 Tax=Enterobacter agglomerans TaxID=549 RepID=UPI001F2C3E07|nr:glycosyl hydrolase family 28-related protein [Pantoea agglomerans]UIL54019.1 hypothetical protein LZU96_08875 [Pantoea agglomerans]
MATQPTQNQVPSESPRDLKFNAGKIDEFVTSKQLEYQDRFGVNHYTIEGLRWVAQQAISKFGYITIDSFQAGATISLPNQALRDTRTGEYYRWDGDLPKIIASNSTPENTGGFGIGAWISVGDASLRASLASTGIGMGASMVGFKLSVDGASSRTLQEKLSDSISVLDFGAKGDGVTDDSAAFQSAHDSLGSNGGVIYIPGGAFWRIEKPINVSKPVTFIGGGNTATTLTRSANQSSTFFNIASEGCGLENLRIIGAGALQSTGGTFAVDATNASSRFYARNVQILFVHSGLRLRSNLFTLDRVEVRDIHYPSGVGIEVDQLGVDDGVGTIGNSVVQNSDGNEPYAGINFKHAIGILLHNTQLMQCGHSIVMAPPLGRAVSSVKIVNCYLDTSDDGGLFIANSQAGNVQRITVADSWLASCHNGAGLRVVSGSNVDGLRVSACEFYDSVNGIQIDDNVTLQNFEVDGAVCAGNTTADVSIGRAVSNVSLRNLRTGTSGGFGASPRGVFLNAAVTKTVVENSTVHDLVDDSFPSTGVVIRNLTGWGFGSVVVDPASLTNGSGQTSTCACKGARMGDMVECSFSNALLGVTLSAWVSASDVVSFRFQNGTGGTVDLGSGTIRVQVSRVS